MSGPARTFPDMGWTIDELHKELMASIDESFVDEQRRIPTFDADWRSGKCVEGTRTRIRQSPLLGRGGGDGRQHGGLWKFAVKYVLDHGGKVVDVKDRCFFERYQDFAFYSAGDWIEGLKLPHVIVEAESNPKELLAELSGLLSVRSRVKYLFIAKDRGILEKLSDYCSSPKTCATDWAGTTYFVIEIPDEPTLPSEWVSYRADVNSDGGKLSFRRT